MLLCDFLGVGLFIVECLVPAADVAVAAFDIEERRLVECLDGLSVALFEADRHQRLDACRRPFVVPGEREDEAPILHDLAIDAGKPALAVLSRLDHRAIGAPNTEIDPRLRTGETLRAHPAL